MKIFADKYERIDSTAAGDIVTISGLKNIVTGDTLCNEAHQVVLEMLKFPVPVIYVSVETKNAIEREKLDIAIEHSFLVFHTTDRWILK